MDLSKAKGLYVGNTPVKYAWFNGRRVWPLDEHDNIGILLTDGSIIPYSQTADSYPKEEVVGVTYADNMAQFCIALDDLPKCYWAGRGVLPNDPEGVVVSSLSTQAVQDIRGKSNTDILAPLLQGTDWAVHVCRNHLFPDGSPGYLGALGEYYAIIKNITVINELLAKCGGTPISTTENYWSSTLNNYDETAVSRIVWIWNGNDYVDGANCQGLNLCRPLCEFMTAEDEEKIRESLVLWYDPARQGATNENMAANPVLKDLTGNGHDATLYNFAWTEMSGVNTDDNGVNILFDGKDDYGKVERLPLFTAEPGYTILIKRKYYTKYQLASKSKIAGTGAFYFDSILNAASFNKITQVAIPTTLVIWQTAHKSNGEDIVPGTAEDSDTMWIGTIRDGDARFCRMNLYSLLLFDRDLTDNEIEWVKKNMIEGEGVMKYDWARSPWRAYFSESAGLRGTGSVTSYRLTINSVNTTNRVSETAVSLPSMESYRIKVSNLPEGVTLVYGGKISGRETNLLLILKDGVYEIPPIEEECKDIGFRFDKTFENENVIIQQLLS